MTENNFQKLAFVMDYAEIAWIRGAEIDDQDGNTIETKFEHWCYGRYVTEIQNLTLSISEIDSTKQKVLSYYSRFLYQTYFQDALST